MTPPSEGTPNPTDENETPTLTDVVPSILPHADQRAAWVVIATVGLALFVGLAYATYLYVGTVTVALFVYYVCRPVVKRIHQRVQSRTLAVVVSLVTVALPVLILVAWTLILLFQALSGLIGGEFQKQFENFVEAYLDISTVVAEFQTFVVTLLTNPGQITNIGVAPVVTSFVDWVLGSIDVLVQIGLQAFIVLVIVYYLLRDDHRIAAWSRDTFAKPGGIIEAYLVRVDRDLKTVFFGNILNALVTGLIGATSYLLLDTIAPPGVRIPEPVLLGLLVGVASLVPLVGIKLVTFPTTLYLLAVSLLTGIETIWYPVLFAIVSFVVVDYIPDQLLRPFVSGRTLHVGSVMLAYTFGPLLFGWYGIFFGPLALVVLYEFGRIVFPWLLGGSVPPEPGAGTDTGPPDDGLGSEPAPPDSEPTSQTKIPPSAMESVDDDASNANRHDQGPNDGPEADSAAKE